MSKAKDAIKAVRAIQTAAMKAMRAQDIRESDTYHELLADRDRLRAALERNVREHYCLRCETILRGADQPEEPLTYHRVNIDGSCPDCDETHGAPQQQSVAPATENDNPYDDPKVPLP